MLGSFLRWGIALVGFVLFGYVSWALVLRAPPSVEHTPTVAVTGASGFLAGHVIKQLLSQGYIVRGSVRSLSAVQKVSHLKSLFPTLQLYEADLLHAGSFDEMFHGCTFVIHTASPFLRQVPDPQRDLVVPALNGTLNVLSAALRSSSVRRVVLTSSTAAITQDTPPADPSYRWTETDWNMESTLKSNPYRLSKRVAEQAAWKFVKDHAARSLEMVALNPSFLVGPPLSGRTDATSVATIKGILEGQFLSSGTLPICFGAVDVRDVARAHVRAMELPDAAGKRFILSSAEGYTHLDFAHMLEPEFGDWPLPTHQQPGQPYCPRLDNSNAQQLLHIGFTPVATAIQDMARQMLKLKMVHLPAGHQAPLSKKLRIAFRKAGRRAFGGGVAGMAAMFIQVLALMWLRTTMNYQYRYGYSTREALHLLYKEGGIGRFYEGLGPALLQGPLARFCDTASNAGVLSLLDAFILTATLPVGIRTLLASATAAALRIFLMPIDALKTTMQVEGRPGARILWAKVQAHGPMVLFAGALASLAAGFVGHYPWFVTYNWLDSLLPKAANLRYVIIRNGAMGVCATICSDTCSNALRVVKTQVQTSPVPLAYSQVVLGIWQHDGLRGFFRGLKTRMLVNVLQGALFAVLWRIILDYIAP